VSKPVEGIQHVDQQFAEIDSARVFREAYILNEAVLADADQVKDNRERWYERSKYTSYAFFALGWALAFYGQLSRKDENPPEAA
jgi:hypothetical protein